jgi:hypothetical protein
MVRRRPGTHYREPPPAFRRQTQEASAHRPKQSRGGNLLQAAQERTAVEAVDASRQRGQVPQGETPAPPVQQQVSQRAQLDSRTYFPPGIRFPADALARVRANRERGWHEQARRENATSGMNLNFWQTSVLVLTDDFQESQTRLWSALQLMGLASKSAISRRLVPSNASRTRPVSMESEGPTVRWASERPLSLRTLAIQELLRTRDSLATSQLKLRRTVRAFRKLP